MAIELQVGNVLQMNFVFSSGTQYGQMIRHFRVSAIGAPGITLEDCIKLLATNWDAELRALMVVTSRYKGVKGQRLLPVPSPVFAHVAVENPGTVTGDALPSQVCGLIRWRTAQGGRRNRGRSYIPFPSETDSGADGNPSASYVSRLDSVAAENSLPVALTVAGRTGTLQPVVYHRNDGTTTDITTGNGIGRWATQRRRSQINRPDLDPLLGVPVIV